MGIHNPAVVVGYSTELYGNLNANAMAVIFPQYTDNNPSNIYHKIKIRFQIYSSYLFCVFLSAKPLLQRGFVLLVNKLFLIAHWMGL